MRTFYFLLGLMTLSAGAINAQLVFPTEIELPEGFAPTQVLMPGSPLDLQVLFIGGVDLVQTTPTYGNPAGVAVAKEWHDFIGFTPDDTGETMGWVTVNHESIYNDDRIGDGGGMTAFRVERDPITGLLNVVDQELSDGREGKFFNVDFVNTVGETGMNCGGISSVVDGRIWTAEEWFRGDNSAINNGVFSNNNALGAGPYGIGSSSNQGVRDTSEFTIDSPDFPAFDGMTIPKYQNFNWMVEIDPREATAIRKQYNWGRQGFEGGAITPDNKYVYLGVDATPGFWLRFVADTPGDFTQGDLQVYKHDADNKWISIGENDPEKLLNLSAEAVAVGATMYNRNEWVTVDPNTGDIYWTETGRDEPAGSWNDEAAAGAVFAPHHLARAIEQGVTGPDAEDYKDYYGRVLKYDAITEEVSVAIEGGPFFEVSPLEADYPEKHLSNPDGLSFMEIDGQSFLIICEDLNGDDHGRMPFENDNANGGLGNRLCELFLLDLSIEDAVVDDLIRITAVPLGAEITGAVVTPDGKSLLVNSQHPSGINPFPYNHSLTFAIHGFDELLVSNLTGPNGVPSETFSAYPNPTLQTVFLNDRQDVALYSQLGQRLRVYRNVSQIDVSQLAAGIYYLQNENGETIEIVKE
ncbi:phosphatase [Lewinellaceae bacterium SD302]|nr:phosphatase [Lewinellaceae bacterium SD302]